MNLTGDEVLPSNQQQIIEEAKAFEKQTETIEHQGEKQIKAIQNKGPIKSIEKFTYDLNDSR